MRAYFSEQDLTAIFDLLVAAKDAGTVDLELRTTSLRIVLRDTTFDAERFTLLVERGDRLVAFGILWRGRYLGMLVHPDARGAVEDAMLGWALRATDSPSQCMALCRSDDALTRRLFERAGLTLAEEELRMLRQLNEPIARPSVPPGFTIRPLAGIGELPAWKALYVETLTDGSSTVARRADTMSDSDYIPELDLVAVDAHGNLAAMCSGAVARYEDERCRIREGKMGPVAVAVRYRRLGLGRAIVNASLQLFQDHGMDVVVLDTDMDNFTAHRLYESVGFRTDYTACWYAPTDRAS